MADVFVIEERERFEKTLSKYRKNKINVPESELNTTYREPFQALKLRLKREAEEFLNTYCTYGYGSHIRVGDSDAVREEFQRIYAWYRKELSSAVFKELEGDRFFELADKLKDEIRPLLEKYAV